MLQVTMSTTTTTSLVIVVCSRVALITVTVMLVPTSLGRITSGQQDVILPPHLIAKDAMRGSASLTNVL